ncbi:hypothetical protein VFPPC_16719 [Pochonia chlamydosporia 170]|uniref:Uncharacterized protein n=1 Tax=Pochonia chlamydosporia 170 TaxID=1380566 RepID=A0A179F746_METCM|nr:hypothetical protein VFPPC_16719 [Pochonia chlamydosporia 170]OAQ61232.1 hypothetical protein VFPPC_16719 [Pochonia chlamydosporia 170]
MRRDRQPAGALIWSGLFETSAGNDQTGRDGNGASVWNYCFSTIQRSRQPGLKDRRSSKTFTSDVEGKGDGEEALHHSFQRVKKCILFKSEINRANAVWSALYDIKYQRRPHHTSIDGSNQNSQCAGVTASRCQLSFQVQFEARHGSAPSLLQKFQGLLLAASVLGPHLLYTNYTIKNADHPSILNQRFLALHDTDARGHASHYHDMHDPVSEFLGSDAPDQISSMTGKCTWAKFWFEFAWCLQARTSDLSLSSACVFMAIKTFTCICMPTSQISGHLESLLKVI